MTTGTIQRIFETMFQYNNVQITQIFSKDEADWIRVRCVPGSTTLELTFLQDGTVQYCESIEEATAIVRKAIQAL